MYKRHYNFTYLPSLSKVNTHPPPPAPVSFECNEYCAAISLTLSMDECPTPKEFKK
jgi:hypothetical protein